ncbi:hypothetical protein [Nocardia sp. No.11]|uniref:hypothetical protein n=1 Tax=Nocardia sp. No.11 TaxID=3128861 RepID=UPI00319E155D
MFIPASSTLTLRQGQPRSVAHREHHADLRITDRHRASERCDQVVPSRLPGPESAEQILRRYSHLLHSLGRDMVRFWHENQPAFRDLGFGAGLRYQFRVLADLMTAPDHAPLDVYHARQALLAISWSVSMMGDLDLSDDDMRTAATAVAVDILAKIS